MLNLRRHRILAEDSLGATGMAVLPVPSEAWREERTLARKLLSPPPLEGDIEVDKEGEVLSLHSNCYIFVTRSILCSI